MNKILNFLVLAIAWILFVWDCFNTTILKQR